MTDDDEAAGSAVVLHYRASDEAFILGVPARDLTDDDLGQLAGGPLGTTKAAVLKRLAASVLYAEPRARPHKAAGPAAPDSEAK